MCASRGPLKDEIGRHVLPLWGWGSPPAREKKGKATPRIHSSLSLLLQEAAVKTSTTYRARREDVPDDVRALVVAGLPWRLVTPQIPTHPLPRGPPRGMASVQEGAVSRQPRRRACTARRRTAWPRGRADATTHVSEGYSRGDLACDKSARFYMWGREFDDPWSVSSRAQHKRFRRVSGIMSIFARFYISGLEISRDA